MRTLIGLGILVVLLVTAIILSASTLLSIFELVPILSYRLSVAESPPTHQSVTHVRNNTFT